MNLLEEKWLPIRRSTGQVDWIAPHQIMMPDIISFAANRADFNGALAQMMIGLLQTTTPVDDEGDWDDLLHKPPSAEVLQEWFAPTAEAFVLDGDGARFMQDFSMGAEGAECTVDALLIDAAGGSAIDKNTDHFVKRDTIKSMCPHCVATALFTLQTNAPAGGAGHRTSLRGGGPLTTLVVETPSHSLWRDLWLNVKPQRAFLQNGGDVQKSAKHFTFPWLTDITKIQAAGGETQPLQVHPHHLFWAMPRRIRLDFSDVQTGQCDVCKRDSAQLVQRYVTKPQGLNYKGVWRHPFSPYYETKEGWLPVHPQPGGFSYKNWLAWVLGSSQSKKSVQAAGMVDYFFQERKKHQASGQFRLWVFGYDMENMKPRCWYETTFPLYGLAEGKIDRKTQSHVQILVTELIEATEIAASYLTDAVAEAWFSPEAIKKWNPDLKKQFSLRTEAMFWSCTEPVFYKNIQDLIEKARSEEGIDMDDAAFLMTLREAWFAMLLQTAKDAFDKDLVGTEAIDRQNIRRMAMAYNKLNGKLRYGSDIKNALHLPLPVQANSSKKISKKFKSSTEPQAQRPL